MNDKQVMLGDAPVTVSITSENTSFRVQRGAREDTIELIAMRSGEADVRVNGRFFSIPFLASGSSVTFHYDGETYSVEVAGKGSRKRSGPGEGSMAAPMPGVVLKILVAPGDQVARNAPLLILEAMKMEHQILAPWDGVVRAIHCGQGDLVQPGVDLVTVDRTTPA